MERNHIGINRMVKLSNDDGIEIEADNFIFDRDQNTLNINGDGSIKIKSQNLELFFEDATGNQNNQTIQINRKCKHFDNKK